MFLLDMIPTTAALSGLVCLMIAILSEKKWLKQYI